MPVSTPPHIHVPRGGSINIMMGNPSPARSSPNRSVPTPSAQDAQNRREGVDIQRSYDRLHKQFKKLSIKSNAQAEELQSLKNNRPKTDQQVSVLKRQIERITADKKKAEARCKVANEARRKIEQKLAGGSGGQYLAEKYQALRTRTRSLKSRCEEQAEVLERHEIALKKAANQIDILARALEVRVYELGLQQSSSSNNNRRTKNSKSVTSSKNAARESLLYEVAQQRHEMQQMASELAENFDTIENLKQKLVNSQTDALSITEVKKSIEEYSSDIQKELDETKDMLAQKTSELNKFSKDRNVILDYIKDKQEENVLVIDEYKNKNNELVKELNDAKDQINLLNVKNSALSEELQTTIKRKTQLEKVQELTEGRLASEHIEISNMRAELNKSQQTCASLASKVASLTTRMESKENEYNSLQDKIQATNDLRTITSDELRVLRDQVATLERDNKIITNDKEKMENTYQKNLEEVMFELENVLSEKEKITNDMNNAANALKSLKEENAILTARLSEKRGEADAMRENKGLLQKTLLDQITTLRDRVQYLEGQLSGGSSSRSRNSKNKSPTSPRKTSPYAESSKLRDSALKRRVNCFSFLYILLIISLLKPRKL